MIRTCSIKDCAGKHRSRGWCKVHYERWRKNGNPLVAYKPFGKYSRLTCSVEGCDGVHKARGWCKLHYERWKRAGDPLGSKARPEPKGTLHNGYRVLHDHGNRILEHRKVMGRVLGRTLSPDEHVHHINGDKLDNRPENLMVLPGRDHTRLHRDLRATCGKGHEWNEDNTYWHGTQRRCRTCDRMRELKRRRHSSNMPRYEGAS